MLSSADFPILGTNFHSRPEVFTFEDAIYHPGVGHYDSKFGLFTREGYLIPQAAFYEKIPSVTKGQPYWIDPSTAGMYPFLDTVIFCGALYDQYGHTITEFLSRLTSLSRIRKNEKILIRSFFSINEIFSRSPKIKDIFSFLNIDSKDIISVNFPVRIHRLIVPTPAFVEQSYCYDEMADYCQSIGNKTIKSLSSIPFKNEIIYVSRSQLICGTIKIDNEKQLDKLLKKKGVKVVYPEQLSFAEQVALFRNHNIVTGCVGSAFHTSIFSANPTGVAISFKNTVDANYLLMDGASGASIDYVKSDYIHDSLEKDPAFFENKTISNLNFFVDELIDFILKKKNSFNIPNMGRFPLSSFANIEFFLIKNNFNEKINLDQRTGEVCTHSGLTYQSLLIMKVIIKDDYFRTFIVAQNGGVIDLNFPLNKGPIYEVNLNYLSKNEGKVAIRCIHTNLYLTSPPSSRGNWCNLIGKSIDSWETFKIEMLNNFIPHSGSMLHIICSILVCKLINNVRGNMDYYLSKYSSLVCYIDAIVKSGNCTKSKN